MTAIAGASSNTLLDWKAIEWPIAVTEVRRLQMRIAKAFREKKFGKVKALQWLLTHSFYAKLLAVKRVVQNQGAKTPGVDGIIWNTSERRIKAAKSLKRRGYQTLPLRRIHIPKKERGKTRPLSIPAMLCRGQQALHLLALEPVSEMLADRNSYGFRPLRSTHDAIAQCFLALRQRTSAQYILEGDIKSCFDNISHSWLLEKVTMDKVMLQKWLAAGYIEKGELYPTEVGTPQGGLCSPTLLVITLSGLEEAVKQSAPNSKDKINVCIYADDFIITGATKEVLEEKVKPAVESFLRERGLSLSPEKTKITHIDEGFDFLGVNIRKYKGKLIIKPAKSNVKRFLTGIRQTIKKNATSRTENLIWSLNSKIRGWANHFRHVCSKKTFAYVDHQIFKALWQWAERRHPKKGKRWVQNKYWRSDKLRNWVFYAKAKVKNKSDKASYFDLAMASKTPIRRHVKLRADATPYNPVYHDYLDERILKRMAIEQKTKRPSWWQTWWDLLKPNIRTGNNRVTNKGLIGA